MSQRAELMTPEGVFGTPIKSDPPPLWLGVFAILATAAILAFIILKAKP